MNGAQIIVQCLLKADIDTIFGYPGGAIMPFYDALIDREIKHILCRHEQGAALAANGYARASGKLGVCVGTSGPGATNLLTGIADAHLDSVPLLAITGQVSTEVMGTDAFQEVDVLGLSLPITKHSFFVEEISQLQTIMERALFLAQKGRPGPVLVDVPKDIQTATYPFCSRSSTITEEFSSFGPSFEDFQAAFSLLENAEHPLVYSGGGITLGNALSIFREFIDQTNIPTVVTLKGIGNLPTEHPLLLGMLGMHGNKAANLCVQECDLLICIGARFDDRVTGKLDAFAPRAHVLHIDHDPAEVNKLRPATVSLVGDLKKILQQLIRVKLPSITSWQLFCEKKKKEYTWQYDHPGDPIYAPLFLKQLSEKSPSNTVITCDVGQHQMWVAQHCKFRQPREHLSSGGLGTMGFGLPAAIGASMSKPEAAIITISGDGSFMMNLQELATVHRYQLPIKIVILDNQRLGLVKQWQELFFEQRYSEVDLSDNPNFVEVANSFSIPGLSIKTKSQVPSALENLLQGPGPFLLHVQIDAQENVWPLVPPGAANQEMLESVTS